MAIPVMRQVSDIRKPDEIKEICNSNTPVFILKNKELCFIAISQEQFQDYETLKARRELRAQLRVAEAEYLAGAKTTSHEAMMNTLKEIINGK